MAEYYIEAGVHRAVAAREAGLEEIEATLHAPDQPSIRVRVRLADLHSNRAAVVGVKTKRRDLPGLIAAMADPKVRTRGPPIDLQPLGVAFQPRSIPLASVVIVAEEDDE